MKITIKTYHGYLSARPEGHFDYRPVASDYEQFEIGGLEDLFALVQPKPAQPAPPPSSDDPLLGCRLGGSSEAFVSCLHDKIQPAGSVEKCFEVVKRVAWGLRASGAGLLLKPGGDNIVTWHGKSFSASRICWPDGRIVKVLTDVPATAGPSWQDNGAVDASLYEPAIDPRT